MSYPLTAEQEQIRRSVREVCSGYPCAYWRELDRTATYPTEFVRTLTEGGWLAALIPEEYGGPGLGVLEASLVLEEIHASGGSAAAGHAQMYTMDVLAWRGSDKQKRRILPELAAGRLRLQAFGVTEPTAGSDTTRPQTRAVKCGDRYIVHGQKVFTSRIEHSDLLLLLVRTTPLAEARRKTAGLSILLANYPGRPDDPSEGCRQERALPPGCAPRRGAGREGSSGAWLSTYKALRPRPDALLAGLPA